jgi:hypothetical protein
MEQTQDEDEDTDEPCAESMHQTTLHLEKTHINRSIKGSDLIVHFFEAVITKTTKKKSNN